MADISVMSIALRLLSLVFACAAAACFCVAVASAGSASALSTEQVLRGDVFVRDWEIASLRARACDAQAKIDSAELTARKIALEDEYRKVLTPPKDTVYDWQHRAFVNAPQNDASASASQTPDAPISRQ
jgi:hypothetical protein